MGRAYTITVPASGGGNVPISLSGATFFAGIGDFQVAYDPADFASDQYARIAPGASSVPIMTFAPNTILWVRQDPTVGAPAVDLSVLTSIGEVNY